MDNEFFEILDETVAETNRLDKMFGITYHGKCEVMPTKEALMKYTKVYYKEDPEFLGIECSDFDIRNDRFYVCKYNRPIEVNSRLLEEPDHVINSFDLINSKKKYLTISRFLNEFNNASNNLRFILNRNHVEVKVISIDDKVEDFKNFYSDIKNIFYMYFKEKHIELSDEIRKDFEESLMSKLGDAYNSIHPQDVLDDLIYLLKEISKKINQTSTIVQIPNKEEDRTIMFAVMSMMYSKANEYHIDRLY